MKLDKLLGIGILMFIVLSVSVLAECVVPYEDMIINESVTLCSGTYYLNDTDGNGAIRIAENNLVVDCNGSELIGNNQTANIAIYNNMSNTLITDCKISEYYTGIESVGENTTIQDNIITKILKEGIYTKDANSKIINNTVSCIYEHKTYRKGIIAVGSSSNLLIENNQITNGCDMGIVIAYNFNKVNISNNIIKNNDRGIRISDSSNIYIYQNNFTNNTNNADDYDLSISLENNLNHGYAENISIYFNQFDEVVGGILIQNYKNVYIENNTFSSININDRGEYLSSDAGALPCIVYSVLLYKGFFTLNNSAYNITHFLYGKSENIQVINNQFDENTQCYILSEETINLTHDINSQRRISFQAPTTLSGKTEIILKENLEKIYRYSLSAIFDYMYVSFKGTSLDARKISYAINGSHNIYKNIHSSETNNIYLLNLSSPFNDIRNTSTGTILAANVDTYTITLSPNQQIEVGNFVNDTTETYHPPNVSVTLTHPSYLNCDYTATDSSNDIQDIDIAWFHDGAFLLNGGITYSDPADGIWQCSVSATDSYNTTIAYSNNVTVTTPIIEDEEESSGGSSGGNSDYYVSEPVIPNTPTNPSSSIDNATSTLIQSDNVGDGSLSTDYSGQSTAPILEQPRSVMIRYVTNKLITLAIIVVFISILIIMIIGKRKTIKATATIGNIYKEVSLRDKLLVYINNNALPKIQLSRLIHAYTHHHMLSKDDALELLRRLN